MGLLRFSTKNTFVEVDVSSIDGSSKDARKVQSWGGPDCFSTVMEDSSTDCSDEEISDEVDDWEVDGLNRITTCYHEEELGAQNQIKTISTQAREHVGCASCLTITAPISPPVSPPLQPTNVVFVQCPFAVMPMLQTPQTTLCSWSLQNTAATSSSTPNFPDTSDLRCEARTTASTTQHSLCTREACRSQDSRENINSTWTSRMVRNIPNDYTRQDFLDLLNAHKIGFDFVYLPMDWNKEANLGYAFVNLVSHEEAVRIAKVLNGFKDWMLQSQKVCDVVWGKPHLQSLQRIIEKFRNSAVMHPDVPDTYKPMVFNAGQRVPFPAPTVQVQKPQACK